MEQRVFAPGTGARPPILAGREKEQEVLTRCLTELRARKAPPHDVVLIGPRGNGKTVLLNWFRGICRDHQAEVDVVQLTPDDISTRDTLIDAVAPRVGMEKVVPGRLSIPYVGSVEMSASSEISHLQTRLITRCSKKPLAVLLDEAHTLNVETGRILLNSSQRVRDEAPFLLVLAGTPGLVAHLGNMQATFWNRLGKGRLSIGRLSDRATRVALVRPLAIHGVEIDAEALDTTVEASQHYPYFVQLWGEALWGQCVAIGTKRLTDAHVDTVRPDVTARVADYYQDRYRELEGHNLLPAAIATALLFQTAVEAASDRDIEEALATTGADAGARLAAREELNRFGYIWEPPGQVPPIMWRAGIPSLMTYVLERATGHR